MNFAGNLSGRGSLPGRGISVQLSAVGKYGRLFSGYFLSNWEHLRWNLGQSLFQLAWLWALQDTQ